MRNPEYPKIHSVFKRDEKTHKFLEGQWSLPEFEYLANNEWEWTEKVDGTNIRVAFEGGQIHFGGRTNNAQIPTFLLTRLQELFPFNKFKDLPSDDICFYGEGYGARVQKGGGNYIKNGIDFILFDVLVCGEGGTNWWLTMDNVLDIANQFGLKTVPIIGCGTLSEALILIKTKPNSSWGGFPMEGLVCKPKVQLYKRPGKTRIITKMKWRDF